MMLQTDLPLITEQTGDILTLYLNRPKQANAMSLELSEGILTALTEAEGVRLAVIRSTSANFCAGFDLSDIAECSDGDLLWRFTRIETMLQAVQHAPFPTLALAQGHVIGAGADLFAACSRRIATPDTGFKFPGWNFELALGTRRLSRLIGNDDAREILLSSRRVRAHEAAGLGLISDLASEDQWDEVTAQYAAQARTLPEFSNRSMLELIRTDTRAEDMAAVVATAGRPGLKERILAFQASVAAARKARRSET